MLDLEALEASAGWQPMYDLRTASDARSVELAYRAEVWQQTGEDWNGVELSLSTAQPSLGAQGPDPQPIWLRLVEPGVAGAAKRPRRGVGDKLGYVAAEAGEEETPAAPPPFASVESQGLSVRFQLPERATIQSRTQPTSVLVGKARLDARPSTARCRRWTSTSGCAGAP